MASARSINEVTECVICAEVYTDPRVLPCGHTYCLKCIDGCAKNVKPGDKLQCPKCRKEFAIPSGGLAELPKNFFVNKLLHMSQISIVERTTPVVICDVCSRGEEADGKAPIAAVYCIDCQNKLCESCAVVHENLKSCQSHSVITVGDKRAMEDIFTSFPPPPCKEHGKDLLRFYCFDCKEVICTSCFIEAHSTHKCSDISSLVEEFHSQMTKDVNGVAAGLQKCQSLLENISKEKREFTAQAARAELDMNNRTEELKVTLDRNREKLANDLEMAKEKRIAELEGVERDIEEHIKKMEGFTTYAAQLQQKGSAFELASEAAGLHDKAEELLMLESIGQAASRLSHIDICFQPSVLATSDGNLVGEVVMLKDFQGKREN